MYRIPKAYELALAYTQAWDANAKILNEWVALWQAKKKGAEAP